jgi:hypothetical protein
MLAGGWKEIDIDKFQSSNFGSDLAQHPSHMIQACPQLRISCLPPPHAPKMPPKVATVQTPHKCPCCKLFFSGLNQHYSSSKDCKAKNNAVQEALHDAALHTRGHFDPDELDDSDEPPGHHDMDIDPEFSVGGTWQYPSSPEGPGPSK